MDEKRTKTENPVTENGAPRPDSETLHTTDPQKHMEGPVSTFMHEAGEAFDSNKSEEQANEEREKNM